MKDINKNNVLKKNPADFLKDVFNGEKGEIARLILSFLIIFFSVYFTSPRRGFVSTLPLIFIAGAVVCLFYDEPVRNTIIAGASSLVISIADYADIKYTAIYTAAVMLFFVVVFTAASLFRKGIEGHDRSGFVNLVISAVIGIFLIFVYFVCMGTPWGNISAVSSVKDYTKEKYPSQTFTSYKGGYYIAEGGYTVDVYYDFKGTNISSPIKAIDDSFEDGYFENAVNILMTTRRTELISYIKTTYLDDSFNMTLESFGKRPVDFRTFDELPDDMPEKYLSDMNFNIIFDLEMPDEKIFAEECQKYAKLLSEGEKVFGTIYFYGGEQEVLKYQLKYTYGDDHSDLSDKVEAYSFYNEFVVER